MDVMESGVEDVVCQRVSLPVLNYESYEFLPVLKAIHGDLAIENTTVIVIYDPRFHNSYSYTVMRTYS